MNERANGMLRACGMAPPEDMRGNCVFSRYFDNDDDWRRVDLPVAEFSSDAAWVKAAKASSAGRRVRPSLAHRAGMGSVRRERGG